MDDSKLQELYTSLGLDGENSIDIARLVKRSLLFGADKLLFARKVSPSFQFDSLGDHPGSFEATNASTEKLNRSRRQNEKVCGESNRTLLESSSDKIDYEYVDVSRVVNCPSGSYNEFPLNILMFLPILALKLIAFQMNLFVRFFTIPIWLTYFSLMFIMFPIQTLSGIKRYTTKKLVGVWVGVVSFICARINAQKSFLKLGLRLGWALLGAIYMCFILVGLLISGFMIGCFAMNRLVEKPIHSTEPLNFDYTKASPVAHVPIMSSSSLGAGVTQNAGARAIPYNHKLQLTVSLTMPESDYNRKLGIFQVRVELLSSNGKTSASKSYPTMLRFKSQPLRVVETVFKSVPLVAGFQSEVQVLNVRIDDFTEGQEPTTGSRVVIEQRAECESGAGIPEIYSATLDLRSELPRLKSIIWSWRRTLFVWISMMAFLTELMIMLILCKVVLLPKGRLVVRKAQKHAQGNNISWY